VANIIYQEVTCINAENISRLKKDEVYFAIETETTYKIYLQDKKTFLGEYSRKRFFNLAKWRIEQIDSIIND
jgi:hypothetical protein